jgi:uncharacterized protein with HEPN domain
MPKRENELLVEDLKECFINILDYTRGLTFDEFSQSRITKDAVVRNLEVVGEASNILT